jgi:hypothetical protein
MQFQVKGSGFRYLCGPVVCSAEPALPTTLLRLLQIKSNQISFRVRASLWVCSRILDFGRVVYLSHANIFARIRIALVEQAEPLVVLLVLRLDDLQSTGVGFRFPRDAQKTPVASQKENRQKGLTAADGMNSIKSISGSLRMRPVPSCALTYLVWGKENVPELRLQVPPRALACLVFGPGGGAIGFGMAWMWNCFFNSLRMGDEI